MCSCGPTQHYPVYTLQSCTGCRSCHYRVPPPQATAPRAAASAHCSWPQQVGHRVERLAEERKLLVEARVVVVQLERAAELALLPLLPPPPQDQLLIVVVVVVVVVVVAVVVGVVAVVVVVPTWWPRRQSPPSLHAAGGSHATKSPVPSRNVQPAAEQRECWLARASG